MIPAPTVANVATWAVQVAVLVSLGAALPHLLRVSSPRARFAYFYALLGACLALPLVQPLRAPAAVYTLPALSSSPGAPALPAPLLPARASGVPVPAPARGWPVPPIGRILLVMFAAGVTVRLVWLALGIRGLARLRRTAAPFPARSRAVEDARALAGVSADLRATPEVSAPVTFGARRPVVLLPHDFAARHEDQQKAVVCHELLHVRRGDWRMTVGEEILRSFAWCHPAIWWLIDRIQLSREQVVDEEVVRLLGGRDVYLDALLRLAAPAPQPLLRPASLFLRKSHLAQRIALLLKEGPMSRRHLVVSSVALAVVLLAGGGFLVRALPLEAIPPELPAARPPAAAAAGAAAERSEWPEGAGAPQSAPVPGAAHVAGLLKLAPGIVPRYPPDALARGAGGRFYVIVRIEEDGRVSAARPTWLPDAPAPDQELVDAALTAARASRFESLPAGTGALEWGLVFTFDPATRVPTVSILPPPPPPPPPLTASAREGALLPSSSPQSWPRAAEAPDPEREAKLLFEKQARPADPDVYRQLAGYYNRIGDVDRTVATLREWAQMDPASPEAPFTIATYLWDRAFRDPALSPAQKRALVNDGLESVDRALALKPDYMEAVVYKSLLYRLLAGLEEDQARRDELVQQANELRDLAVRLRAKKD